MSKRIKEYEVRTIDEHGDALNIIDSYRATPAGYEKAVSGMPLHLGGNVAAVVLELATHHKNAAGEFVEVEYSDVLHHVGDLEALRSGGWIE